MENSTYKIIELVGFSEKSWEDAAREAVSTASKTLRNIRVAEVKEMDLRLKDNQIMGYRVKLKVSFKLEG